MVFSPELLTDRCLVSFDFEPPLQNAQLQTRTHLAEPWEVLLALHGEPQGVEVEGLPGRVEGRGVVCAASPGPKASKRATSGHFKRHKLVQPEEVLDRTSKYPTQASWKRIAKPKNDPHQGPAAKK